MASDIRLLNMVDFDEAGKAVIQPLKRWKVDFRSTSIESNWVEWVQIPFF